MESLISAIQKANASQAVRIVPAKANPPTVCKTCGGQHFWRIDENHPWTCWRCERAPISLKSYDVTSQGIVKRFGDSETFRRPTKPSEAIQGHSGSSKVAPSLSGKPPDSGGVIILVETITLNATEPVCEHCGCRWYDELIFSDGSVRMQCWTCKQPTDGRIKWVTQKRSIKRSRVKR